MADLAKEGLTMVVVTHSMHFARTAATTVHVMHQGQLAESGSPQAIFENPQTDAVKTFLTNVRP
jgi:ABC-type histidine transport system ATPase subunit